MNTLHLNKKWLNSIGLMVFLTILSGVILRALYITPMGGLKFTNLMHAHSHLAILGWVYPAIMALFFALFVGGKTSKKAVTVMLATQVINFCMFFAFIYQGYAVFSIIFSSLHIILSYVLIYLFYREVKGAEVSFGVSSLFIKGSVFFLLLGSFGPWILAYWNAAKLDKNFIYDLLVHTFLHFQINGWITLALLGILLFILEKERAKLHTGLLKIGFWLYSIALLPSIILNVDWTQGSSALLPLAISGWMLKIIGIGTILYAIVRHGAIQKSFTGWARTFMIIGLLALFAKTSVEAGNTIPALIPFSMYTRNIVVGYLHLGLIGFASFFLIAYFIKARWIEETTSKQFLVVITGFFLYEMLLFGDGLLSTILAKPIPTINVWLLVVTVFLSAGVLFIIKQTRMGHRV